ncbi:putative nwd2 protein [Mycena sanguinolenta]|uniref:Putative nwd2 protein n=1 Tax=Mycena sanguinolenta TaxID=230812 RepID=A0A8H6Z8V7_9AGAR|nr:putative nwd2 protein [Mycena sanguinolenta]
MFPGAQMINNYINGGRGGAGGRGYRSGTGGAGGQGTGPSVNFNIKSSGGFTLALNVEWLRAPISQVVEQNPSIVARSIAVQMQELISEPCCSREHQDPIVILIDGLDECDEHGVQGEVLRAIQHPSSNHPIFLRFIIASRPEPHIRQVFQSSSSHCHSFNVEQSFEDVRKYLRDEFSRVHRNHLTMQNISSPWPGCDVLEELVWRSSGYFIYASTIIKFIEDENYRPIVRLEVVRNANGPGSESAYDALDRLYMTILSSVPRQSELTPILGAIVNFRLPPEEIDKLFRLAEGETLLLLRGLHSVLKIQSSKDIISSHHASFLDFLDNPGRSRTFCIGTLHYRIDLARIILEAYVGPPKKTDRFFSIFLADHLVPFINTLPPSVEVAELLPRIGAIEPEFFVSTTYIMMPSPYVPRRILAWVKQVPSAPRDIINLWEEYECMVSLEQTVRWGPLSAERIFPRSPEFLRILVSLVVFKQDTLLQLRGRLDLTWTEMRTSMSCPSSNVAMDEHELSALTVRQAFRDVALQCLRKIVKTQNQAHSRGTRDELFKCIRSIGSHIGVNATGKHILEQ